jgi:xanthine dehydrogenase YagS FAD-binding subunit
MKQFELAQPQTIELAASLLSDRAKGCMLMAGGTDLLDEMKNEIASPEIVVDLLSISGLSYIIQENQGLKIGALTPISELQNEFFIEINYSVLHQAVLSLASPQLRNMGTVGGNLCQRPRCWYYRDSKVECRKKGGSSCFAQQGRNKYHAIFGGGMCYIVHPSDLAPALISLDAEVIVQSPKGERKLKLEDFFKLPSTNIKKENVLSIDEIVKEIRIPPTKEGAKSTYYKLKERGTWDFAVVSAAVSGILKQSVFKDIGWSCSSSLAAKKGRRPYQR